MAPVLMGTAAPWLLDAVWPAVATGAVEVGGVTAEVKGILDETEEAPLNAAGGLDVAVGLGVAVVFMGLRTLWKVSTGL